MEHQPLVSSDATQVTMSYKKFILICVIVGAITSTVAAILAGSLVGRMVRNSDQNEPEYPEKGPVKTDVSGGLVQGALMMDLLSPLADPLSVAVTPSVVKQNGLEKVDDSICFHVSSAMIHKEAKTQIKCQQRDLDIVGCRPTMQVFMVDSLLANDDLSQRESFQQQQVAVGRCVPSCSYCKSLQQTCRPVNGTETTKTFLVRFITKEGRRLAYHRSEVTQHTHCECQ